MPNDKLQSANNQFFLYQDDNGVTNVNVRFDGQDVWLSQQQIALLFDTTQQNISLHINGIQLVQEAGHFRSQEVGVFDGTKLVHAGAKRLRYLRENTLMHLSRHSPFDISMQYGLVGNAGCYCLVKRILFMNPGWI